MGAGTTVAMVCTDSSAMVFDPEIREQSRPEDTIMPVITYTSVAIFPPGNEGQVIRKREREGFG
jgi:hypothetical protein